MSALAVDLRACRLPSALCPPKSVAPEAWSFTSDNRPRVRAPNHLIH
jgi:hypothetical protein